VPFLADDPDESSNAGPDSSRWLSRGRLRDNSWPFE